VIFRRQAPGLLTYAFENTRIAENDLWLIKAVCDEDSAINKEPQQLNEEILAMVESKLGHSLTLTGGSVTWNVEREADIPEFMETATDRVIYHNGFLLRVWTA
jgi:predicted Zn-dependent protease